jgi:CRISPR-associated protein Csm3
MSEQKQLALKGKLFISGKLKVVTGMHIGGSSDFAPIGAVDSPFIRDSFTHEPIIPGSSLKGKLRTLLAKLNSSGYLLNKIEDDNEVISRLFGSTKEGARPARLQFFDLFVDEDSRERYRDFDTDTYLGEVKFENTICRTIGVANPRQIERVPAGLEFAFKLVYNVELIEEAEEDLRTLAQAFELLEMDYLGGHGSRGYGRVAFSDLSVSAVANDELDTAAYEKILQGK